VEQIVQRYPAGPPPGMCLAWFELFTLVRREVDPWATGPTAAMAVGALERKFYIELLAKLAIDEDPADRNDRARWPALLP
jgi:hypothetical protein